MNNIRNVRFEFYTKTILSDVWGDQALILNGGMAESSDLIFLGHGQRGGNPTSVPMLIEVKATFQNFFELNHDQRTLRQKQTLDRYCEYAPVVYAVWYKLKGRDQVKGTGAKTNPVTLEQIADRLRFFLLPYADTRMRLQDPDALTLGHFVRWEYFRSNGLTPLPSRFLGIQVEGARQ